LWPNTLLAAIRRRLLQTLAWGRVQGLGFGAWGLFFIDNLLVRIHLITVMIRWTGLAPWEFEFPFPGSLTSTFLDSSGKPPGAPPRSLQTLSHNLSTHSHTHSPHTLKHSVQTLSNTLSTHSQTLCPDTLTHSHKDVGTTHIQAASERRGDNLRRAKRGQLKTCWGLLPESQGHNLVLTVLCVPYSLDSG